MKKLKKLLTSPRVTVAAFVLAIALLGFSTIGGASAALTYYSENYVSTVMLQEIGVNLLENGVVVAHGGETAANAGENPALLRDLYLGSSTQPEAANTPFKPGAQYREALSVQNPAEAQGRDAKTIVEYVRVTIYRYWEKQNEQGDWVKAPELDPSLIELGLPQNNGWVEDTQARTDERIVLYYTQPLQPGEETPPFVTSLSIDPSAASAVRRTTVNDRVVTTYLYDNAGFQLAVVVDAVQEHNAQSAILSAWGRAVDIDGSGTLHLL